MTVPALGYCAECTAGGKGAHFKTGIDRLCCPLLYPKGIPSKILAEKIKCPKFVEKDDEEDNDEGVEDTTEHDRATI